MLADPEIFCGPLIPVLEGDLEASGSASAGFGNVLDHMRHVVQHSLQASLGPERCHGQKLAQALAVSFTVLTGCLIVIVFTSFDLHNFISVLSDSCLVRLISGLPSPSF